MKTPLIYKSIIVCLIGIILLFLYQNWQRNIVVRVVDGDSMEMRDGRRVRLLGIDAPEKGLCFSEEAKRTLSDLVFGKHVRLKNIVPDAYGRTLATVIVEDFPTWISYMKWRYGGKPTLFPIPDPLVSRQLLALGLAKNTGSNTSYKNEFSVATKYAKDYKLGIYSDQCRGPSEQSECQIKGNIRQGKKVYYVSTCKTYNSVIVDQSFGDQWFCLEGDAIKNGFLKAQSCQ